VAWRIVWDLNRTSPFNSCFLACVSRRVILVGVADVHQTVVRPTRCFIGLSTHLTGGGRTTPLLSAGLSSHLIGPTLVSAGRLSGVGSVHHEPAETGNALVGSSICCLLDHYTPCVARRRSLAARVACGPSPRRWADLSAGLLRYAGRAVQVRDRFLPAAPRWDSGFRVRASAADSQHGGLSARAARFELPCPRQISALGR